MDEMAFRSLLGRVRGGDADAAEELVRHYEPAVHRFVRLHLTDPRLRRVVDTMDVCQSVLGGFFVRVAAGQFDLERPEQLVALLTAMARNRLLNHLREQKAARRDQRRVEPGSGELLDQQAAAGKTPSSLVAGRELLERVLGGLSPEERYLADQRGLGREWADLAAELNSTPDALRKKLTRAIDRVGEGLGLEPDDV